MWEKIIKEDIAISTHTLTWSVTIFRTNIQNELYHFNSHAHVERDGWYLVDTPFSGNFNSHAHVERDDSMIEMEEREKISTHTLTWSVTSWSKD